jgi:hypothetical protein
MIRGLLGLLLVFFSTLGTGQQSPGSEFPRVLKPGFRKTLTVPGFGFYGEPACDTEGNLFFHLDTGPFNDAKLFRLSEDGQKGTLFNLPPELANKLAYNSFAVSPSGTLYLLGDAIDRSGEYLVEFSSDGTVRSTNHLDLTENVEANAFAVFDSGAVLLSGYFNRSAPESIRGQNYIAIFQPSGKLAVRIERDFGKTDDVSKALAQAVVALGPDGNAYAMGKNEILVISESGQVVRRLPFKKPELKNPQQQWAVTRLNVTQGVVAIVLTGYDPQKHDPAQREYLVLSTSTGDLVGLYAPSSETGTEDVCFSQSNGFIFLSGDKATGTQKVDAPLR